MAFKDLMDKEEELQQRKLSLVAKREARKEFDKIVESIHRGVVEGAQRAFREKTNDITITPTITVFEELERLFACSNDQSFFVNQLCRYIRNNPTYFLFADHAQLTRRSIEYMGKDERTAFWYSKDPFPWLYDFETFDHRYLVPLKQLLENSKEMSNSKSFKDTEYDVFCNSKKIFGSKNEDEMRVACILICIEMFNLPTKEEINLMLNDIGFVPLHSKSDFDKAIISLLTQIQDKKARERLQKNLIVEFPAENVKKCLESTFETIYPCPSINEEVLEEI